MRNKKNGSILDWMVQFLTEFQDAFSEEIIAEKCNVVEHTTKDSNLKDSNPIKQTPRVLFYLWKEVDKNYWRKMRQQKVIKNSRNP